MPIELFSLVVAPKDLLQLLKLSGKHLSCLEGHEGGEEALDINSHWWSPVWGHWSLETPDDGCRCFVVTASHYTAGRSKEVVFFSAVLILTITAMERSQCEK